MPRYINSAAAAAAAVKEDRNVGLWCCGLISSQADPGDVNKTVPSNNVVVVNAELDRNRRWEF